MLFHVRMDVHLPADLDPQARTNTLAKEKAYSQRLQRDGQVAAHLANRRRVRQHQHLRRGGQRRTARPPVAPAAVPLHGHQRHAAGPAPVRCRAGRKTAGRRDDDDRTRAGADRARGGPARRRDPGRGAVTGYRGRTAMGTVRKAAVRAVSRHRLGPPRPRPQPRARQPFTVADLAQSLLAAWPAERARYAGVSVGGATGLELALRGAGSVTGVAVLCSGRADRYPGRLAGPGRAGPAVGNLSDDRRFPAPVVRAVLGARSPGHGRRAAELVAGHRS